MFKVMLKKKGIKICMGIFCVVTYTCGTSHPIPNSPISSSPKTEGIHQGAPHLREHGLLKNAYQKKGNLPLLNSGCSRLQGEKLSTDGPIYRKKLEQFLKKGPQVFLSQLKVRPAFHKGEFRGWRIKTYHGPGPIKKNDIILSANCQPIERPEQFMQVWQNLKRAKDLRIELIRAEKKLILYYHIIDK